VDLEWAHADTAQEQLCLVQLATDSLIVIVDVVEACSSKAEVRSLLSTGPLADRLWLNSSISKVFWDCRYDMKILDSHGVELLAVLDAQLLDVMTRSSRGETRSQQLDRLHPAVWRGLVNSQPAMFAHVQRLNGLEGAISEHMPHAARSVCRGSGSVHEAVRRAYLADPSYWLQRPLPAAALQYAAEDVHWTRCLWEQLLREVQPSRQQQQLQQLQLATQRYADVQRHLDAEGVLPVFKFHSLLPLQVLELQSSGQQRKCAQGCKRLLPTEQVFSAHGQCHVCRALVRAQASRDKAKTRKSRCSGDY
jgi:3'-5' exonuclease